MEGKQHSRNVDRSRLERLKSGDMNAFEEVFVQHRRGILAYVRGMVGEKHLAEDIVQDTFVRLARSVAGIRPGLGISGWLYRTARNRTIDTVRHRRFEVLADTGSPGDSALAAAGKRTPTPADEAVQNENRSRVRDCLARLPDRQRDVLMLRYYGDLSFREVAQVLGRPLGTVLWQARGSMERLREMLRAEEPEVR